MKDYNKDFLWLYDNKERIPEFILREVLCNNRIIMEEFDENRRWSRAATSIVAIPVDGGERMFAIYWDEGLTECQDNNYWGAAEVEYRADMKQVKVEIVTEKYIDIKTGDVAAATVKTTELE
jgi:hypothetical protein